MIKKTIALLSRFAFALIGGFFKEPFLYLLGLFGLLVSAGFNWELITGHKEHIDLSKATAEILKTLVALTLYVKANVSASKNLKELEQIVQSNLEAAQKKLLSVGLEISWTEKDVNVIAKWLYPYWAKKESWSDIENEFVQSVDNLILTRLGLSGGQRLLAQYLIYDLFPLVRSSFLATLSSADLSPISPVNEFVSLFKEATTVSDGFDLRRPVTALSVETAQQVFRRLSTGNLQFFKERLLHKPDREALVAVAEQCIREGYTSIEQILKFRRERQPFKMLIKYDERFTYFERDLRARALRYYKEAKAKALAKTGNDLFKPFPFSYALSENSDILVQLLPHDKFLYVFDMNKLKEKHGISKAEKFISKYVVPLARKYHDQKLEQLNKLDKAFVNVRKQFVANYYVIDIDVETMIVSASEDAIPDGMKRIFVQDVLANGDFAQLLSSQELYLRRIIETMPFDALLFGKQTNGAVKEFFKRNKLSVHKALKKVGVEYQSISQKKLLKNKIQKVTDTIFAIQKKTNSIGSLTKGEIRDAILQIVTNSEKLLEILEHGISAN